MIGPESEFIHSSESAVAVSLGRGRATRFAPPGRLTISFIGGACEGRTGLELTGERMAIGRDEECELVLEGETVSRQHCEIRRQGTVYLLRDASRNGTYVNGERIAQAMLRDGDQIRVGANILLVHLVPGRATTRLARRATTPHRQGPAGVAVELRPLIVVKGLEEGVTQPFSEDGITIGRRLENHVVLEADNISRQHLAIERRDGHYFVRDLGSANGTFLNEQRIDLAPLTDGDRLRVGNFTALVSLVDQDCILNFKRNTK